MMNQVDEKKQSILNDVDAVLSMDKVREQTSFCKALDELKDDINHDFFTIVVLGEFKRGKSTLVNAILGEALLPTDVLPETATINAIMYSDEPSLNVVMNDGTEKIGEPSEKFLKQYSAQNPKAISEKVKYIKVGYPSALLKNRIVLVDTPGVSDINEQRCEVTYRFLPKANAVVFLLDANSPLKKTEKDFIDQYLLPLGLDHILFVANKYDQVDEEEDEGLIEDIEKRLNEAFKMGTSEAELDEIILLPLSAQMALEGIVENNEAAIEESGIKAVMRKLKEIIFSGSVEERKIEGYKIRLRGIIAGMINALANERHIFLADADTLKKAEEKLQSMLNDEMATREKIAQFVEKEKANIMAMADKSIAYSEMKMNDTMIENVQIYQGEDFKDFVEKRVARSMQKNIEVWIAAYAPHIDRLLKKLEQELAHGMSYHFNQAIKLEAAGREFSYTPYLFNVASHDVSDSRFKAGAVAAGGSMLLMATVGGLFMPFVGLLASPFLQKYFLSSSLEKAKAGVLPQLEQQMGECFAALKLEVHKYLDERCEAITANTEQAYDMVLRHMQEQVANEIAAKENEATGNRERAEEIGNVINSLNKISEKCGGR